jgi:hypothetical protein
VLLRVVPIWLVAASVLAACGGGGSSPALEAVACAPAGTVHYAGARRGDCVASSPHHFVVAVDGYEVLVGNWKRTVDDAGQHLICAGVNVEDVASEPEVVSVAQFSLLTPTGVSEAGSPAITNGLGALPLASGNQEGGSVCWADPGLGGQYEAVFSPGPAAAGEPPATRAIWLISFLPAR